MNEVLLGIGGGAALAIAAVFWGFHRRRHDRFFALFAIAFAAMGANRLLLLVVDDRSESESLVYLLRAFAFLLIIVAVVDRNRAGAT